MQLGAFFVLMVAGIVAGLAFEIGKAIKVLVKNKIYFTISIDFITALLMGGIFAFVEYNYLNFQVYVFGVLTFIFAIFVERISLGFLVAKTFSLIYNVAVKALKRLASSRLGKKALK